MPSDQPDDAGGDSGATSQTADAGRARPRSPLARARRTGVTVPPAPHAPHAQPAAADLATDDLTTDDLTTDDVTTGDPVVPVDAPPPPAEPGAEPPPAARKSRAGRDLPAAIGVGVGLGAVIVVSLFAYRPSFAVIVGLAVLYGSWELSRAVRPAGIRLALLPVMVGGAATLVAAWVRGPSGLVLAVSITLIGIVVWRIGDGAEGYARDTGASALVLLYLPTLAAFAVLLVHPHDGAARVLAFVATVVCSDTGGYASGVLFGRHPLAPIVSKGKTWEGFAGSVVACSAVGVLFLTLTFHQAWWQGLLFGVAVALTATVGDLGESMIKRDLGIKDMGTLLPGHGGLMDRLDSLLPCAAVAYLLLSAFAPA